MCDLTLQCLSDLLFRVTCVLDTVLACNQVASESHDLCLKNGSFLRKQLVLVLAGLVNLLKLLHVVCLDTRDQIG